MAISEAEPSVLIVDDEAIIRKTLRKSLSREGFRCGEAGSAEEALQCLKSNPSEVVILDITMPGKSGFDLLPEIKETFPETAVVMATAIVEPDTIVQCMKNGAEDYITKPFDVDQIVESIRMVLQKRKLALDLNRQRDRLEGELVDRAKALQEVFSSAVESLISALEAKDAYTAGHSRRVTDIAIAIGHALRLPDEELEDLRWAALLHDIGKIGIDPTVQMKPSKLTPDEYEYILKHCSIGPSIVQSLVNHRIVEIIGHHHDHYNGSRIHQTVQGSAIPLGARILSVADTFDAMTSDRPYRSAVSVDAAITEIKRCVGTQFDPDIVEAFLKISLSVSV